jgi:hypothetical protein
MTAAAPSRTIAEGPPYRQPPGWSCDGSNWIFFDRECGRRKLPKHHHHPMIAADGKDSVEARREPASAFESLPPPVKPLQISLNGESAAKPEENADGRGNWRAAHPQTAHRGELPTDAAGRPRVLLCRREAEAGEARAYLRPQPRSFSGHRFGHSFARTECEQTFANATKIAEFSRIVRRRTSFGTRGSQVQILPLRPRFFTARLSTGIVSHNCDGLVRR